MKRYIVLMVMLFGVLGGLFAQDSTSIKKGSSGFIPEVGDFSGAILFGRGNFLNSGLDVPPSANYSWSVPGTAPFNNTIDANSNSVSNIIGAEMRYFLTSKMALKLSGAGITRNTPAMTNVPGYIDKAAPNAAWIPAYKAVVAESQVDVNVNLGYEYHFQTKYNRLSPYIGLNLPFYYGRRSLYDPTIDDSRDPSDPLFVVDVGVRHVELYGVGAQASAGVDYYLMEGFYFGFEIKPVSYVYSFSEKFPAPGLESLQAENHSWSFFSQTFLKIGFRF